MRRLLPWLTGAAGGMAAYKLVSRRRSRTALPAAPAGEEPAPDPRAEELRAKLEARDDEPAPAVAGDPDTRRARVHEDARATVDRMRRTASS